MDLSNQHKILMVFLEANTKGLDPIRIMKGLFLYCMEAPKEWDPPNGKYEFKPYDYGPFSQQIYSDLRELISLGLINAKEVPGYNWSFYSLTTEGEKISKKISREKNPDAVEYLKEIREFVKSASFHNLLVAIYKDYPDFAVNSVFRF